MLLLEIKKLLNKIQEKAPVIEDLRITFRMGYRKALIIRASYVHNDQLHSTEYVCTKKDMDTIDHISLAIQVEDTIISFAELVE